MQNKKKSKDCNGRLPIPRKVKRGFSFTPLCWRHRYHLCEGGFDPYHRRSLISQ